jgi:hypothetical protein
VVAVGVAVSMVVALNTEVAVVVLVVAEEVTGTIAMNFKYFQQVQAVRLVLQVAMYQLSYARH